MQVQSQGPLIPRVRGQCVEFPKQDYSLRPCASHAGTPVPDLGIVIEDPSLFLFH